MPFQPYRYSGSLRSVMGRSGPPGEPGEPGEPGVPGLPGPGSDISAAEIQAARQEIVEARDEFLETVADAETAVAEATNLASFYARYDADPDGTLVIVTGDSPSEGGTPGGGGVASFDDAAAQDEFLEAVNF